MSAAAVPAATARVRAREASGPVLPLAAARGAAWLALAIFGALHWAQLVEPAEPRRGWWAVGIGLGAVLALTALRRAPTALRIAGALVVAYASLALALLAAGIADELVVPAGWGELSAGLTRGVEAIPGVRVPYRGLDEWTRVTIMGGGTLLTVLAALLTFWPRRGRTGFRGAALIALVALYVTPAVALNFDTEFARGALLTILVIAFLRLERLGVRDLPGAATVGCVTAVLALIVAPALDRDTPWWDYETWALSAASSKSTAFNWDHEYGPLDWPRDGRELLRIEAQRFGTYWKADSLDLFDGTRWRRQPLPTRNFDPQLPDDLDNIQAWTQEIKVTVRNLRSRTFITAGTTDEVVFPRRQPIASGVSGIFTAPRTLRRGDSYSARVYTPRAPARDLRASGTFYEEWLRYYRWIGITETDSPLVRDSGDLQEAARTEIAFPAWGSGEQPLARSIRLRGAAAENAAPLLEGGSLARTWALSQRLKAASDTPYDFARSIERYLSRGFIYTETPPETAGTLEGFLFEAKTGYCQQFSGAMALMLRMGGVPARVATGFTSGSQDKDSKEFVVRDFDAHSWVEAWFPGYGWIVFDPTPSSAPPRSQADRDASAIAGIGDVADLGAGDRLDPRTGAAGEEEGSGVPWLLVLAGAAGGALVLLAAWRFGRPLLHRRRGARTPLGELERALRRARREPVTGQTLQVLESRLADPAAGYVRAVREERFAGRPTAPTAAQRRALRTELGRGSLLSRLRAWWALPPFGAPRRGVH